MYDMSGFSYDITDVVHLLQLRVRHKNSSSMDVNCPFCGETKGKMNVNLQKNVFRCNRCDASGGMLELYGRLHTVDCGNTRYKCMHDCIMTMDCLLTCEQ